MSGFVEMARTQLTSIRRIVAHRQLIMQLARREVIGRYRGSVMGLAWSFLNPLLMLAVYTIFFTVLHGSRIGSVGAINQADFAITLFAGLIIHGFFAECINRAPSLIVSNANYVKKVVFPLEILPIVNAMAALFHVGVSLTMLVSVQLLLNQTFAWTMIFFPLLILPFALLTLGLSWFLAAIGVYVRDVSQLTVFLTTVLLFLSPVFYAVETLPARVQPFIRANPLTFVIEQSRAVLLHDAIPDWQGLAVYTLMCAVIAGLGLWSFQKMRKGFADVL